MCLCTFTLRAKLVSFGYYHQNKIDGCMTKINSQHPFMGKDTLLKFLSHDQNNKSFSPQ